MILNKKIINKLYNKKKNFEIYLTKNTKKRESQNLQTKIIEAPPQKLVKKNQNYLFLITKQGNQKKKYLISNIDENNDNLEERNNQSSIKIKKNNINFFKFNICQNEEIRILLP